MCPTFVNCWELSLCILVNLSLILVQLGFECQNFPARERVVSYCSEAAARVSPLYLHHRIVENCSLAFCWTCQLFISPLDVFAGEGDKGWDEDRVRVIPTPWGAATNITALPTPTINPSFSSPCISCLFICIFEPQFSQFNPFLASWWPHLILFSFLSLIVHIIAPTRALYGMMRHSLIPALKFCMT